MNLELQTNEHCGRSGREAQNVGGWFEQEAFATVHSHASYQGALPSRQAPISCQVGLCRTANPGFLTLIFSPWIPPGLHRALEFCLGQPSPAGW